MPLRKKTHSLLSGIFGIVVVILSVCQPVLAQQMPEADKINFPLGGGNYSAATDTANCSTSTTTLTGTDNPSKIWNFFRAKGLDSMHVAAIMGNIQQESGFNPLVVEGNKNHPELPRTTTDPASLPAVNGWPIDATKVRQPGWGIVQWTPSGKVVAIAKGFNITSPISDLATQLDVLWQEMNTRMVGSVKFIDGFKATSVLGDATDYFTVHYEVAGIVGPRLTNATNLLNTYGSSSVPTATSSDGSCPGGATLSPDCASATGSARILCAAKAYDPASYQETMIGGHQGGAAWHKSCPTINASCYVDCSGLVNMAVYDAFGVDLRQNTYAEATDTKNWQKVSLAQIQPGDLVQPNPGHVEIIDHVSGTQFFTFGAHNPNVSQPQQVGASSFYSAQSGNVYLHYIGRGAS